MLKPICLLFLLTLLSCQQSSNSIDPETLKNVERSFSQLSKEKGMHRAFGTFVAHDGVVFRPNSFPIEGKENVMKRITRNPDTTFRLTWEPMFARMAKSGDLGYTYGTYLVASINGDSLGVGTYVTIWELQENGEWRFVFDAGNKGLGIEQEENN